MTNLEKIQNNYDKLGVSSLIYKDFFQIDKKNINAPVEKMSYGHGRRIHRKYIYKQPTTHENMCFLKISLIALSPYHAGNIFKKTCWEWGTQWEAESDVFFTTFLKSNSTKYTENPSKVYMALFATEKKSTGSLGLADAKYYI